MSMFYLIHSLIWSCLTIYAIFTILAVVQCYPRMRIWAPLTTPGHCINTSAAYLSSGVFNVITDFAILFLPMPSLWKLQMPKHKKILTIAIFATGSL